jgi:hypothetical protein
MSNSASWKLTTIDQSVFCAFDQTIIYPVEGSWGKQGWTMVNLKAYCTVAPSKLAQQYKSEE